MSQKIDETKNKALAAMIDLKFQYGHEIQYYEVRAMHISQTDKCMIVLPCKYRDKNLRILVSENPSFKDPDPEDTLERV